MASRDSYVVMAIDQGMANQYVKDLSMDTKRGIRAREQKGLPNGVAPIGFKNDLQAEPGDRGWIVDEERFPLVKQLLERFSSGKHSIRQLVDIANNEMGLRTPAHRKQGGKKLGLSYVAGTLLRNPVYAGFFIAKSGIRHELHASLPRAISENDYWHIQKILRNKGRPRPSLSKDLFPYKESASCGGCGGSVTAEKKYQLICSNCKLKFAYLNKEHCPGCTIAISRMSNPKYLQYIYYHCTRKKNPKCKEGSVVEADIDTYLSAYFKGNLSISKDLAEWCVRNLDCLDVSDRQNDFEKKGSLERSLLKKENEHKELVLMKARGLITDSDFLTAATSLKAEIGSLESEIVRLGNVDPKRLAKAHRAFNLATGIELVFRNGSPNEKREALYETGSNLTFADRTPSIYHANLYSVIIKGLQNARAENPKFEPENSLADKDETDVFTSVRPTLLRG